MTRQLPPHSNLALLLSVCQHPQQNPRVSNQAGHRARLPLNPCAYSVLALRLNAALRQLSEQYSLPFRPVNVFPQCKHSLFTLLTVSFVSTLALLFTLLTVNRVSSVSSSHRMISCNCPRCRAVNPSSAVAACPVAFACRSLARLALMYSRLYSVRS